MKISSKLYSVLIIFLLSSNLSYASSINDIIVVDDSNINFDISRDVTLPAWDIEAEIKVMKDINISFISKDFEDKNKLILNLSTDLSENSSYSLITILWPDWNMDFSTSIGLEDKEILATQKIEASVQWITRLLIVNSKIIELYFNNIIEEDELEFKLFNELSILELKLKDDNNLNINLLDKLEKTSNYILMILSMNDNYWNYIDLDEDLYEITTDQNLKIQDSVEDIEENIIETEEETVEDVALNSAETPDTWPETTVLIMLTLILNTVYIFRKKIIKK